MYKSHDSHTDFQRSQMTRETAQPLPSVSIIPPIQPILWHPSNIFTVAFTDTERLIGDSAKNQVAMNPVNTVFDAKRLIGRKFADAEVQADMKHFPFKIIDKAGKPVIQV
jgi:hypothetical protein